MQLLLIEECPSARGRPGYAKGAGVEPVAAAGRYCRGTRDRLAHRSDGRASDRSVAVYGPELRKEKADARRPVVDIRLEGAVHRGPRLLGIHSTHPAAPAVIPNGVRRD